MPDNQEVTANPTYYKKYNDIDWEIHVILTDMYTKKSLELETDNITKIEFVNSLTMFVPTITINYTDYKNNIARICKEEWSIFIN